MSDEESQRPYATAQTIALIKPDAVRRRKVGIVLAWMEDAARLEIVSMRMLTPDLDIAGFGRWNPRKFYARQHEGAPYYEDLVAFMCSGPTVAVHLKGGYPEGNAIGRWRDVMGSYKEPDGLRDRKDWQRQTVRGSLMLPGSRPMENLVHGSDSLQSFIWEYDCLRDVL